MLNGPVPLDIDVLLAPHHGADHASSAPFIAAASPLYVLFPAGTRYGHPRAVVAERYLAAGVPVERIFRTDLGDNEGKGEWAFGSTPEGDRRGDDDVDVRIDWEGNIRVEYRKPPDLN